MQRRTAGHQLHRKVSSLAPKRRETRRGVRATQHLPQRQVPEDSRSFRREPRAPRAPKPRRAPAWTRRAGPRAPAQHAPSAARAGRCGPSAQGHRAPGAARQRAAAAASPGASREDPRAAGGEARRGP